MCWHGFQIDDDAYMFVLFRGDHTWVDFYLAVLAPKTDAVVFSIDGSFTASVSIMGKDPKVRPGSIDVVRLTVH
jgi:membrane-associated phosphatidylinositol transfer protein